MYNNSIVITFDFDTNTYNIQQHNITDNESIVIYFVFISGSITKNILFNNLSFGILIQLDNNSIILNKGWPIDDSVYLATDQDFLEFTNVNLATNTKYKMFLWTEYNNTRYQQELELEIPYIEELPDYEVQ